MTPRASGPPDQPEALKFPLHDLRKEANDARITPQNDAGTGIGTGTESLNSCDAYGSTPSSTRANPPSPSLAVSDHRDGSPSTPALPTQVLPPEGRRPQKKDSRSFGMPPHLPTDSFVSGQSHYSNDLSISNDGTPSTHSGNGPPDIEAGPAYQTAPRYRYDPMVLNRDRFRTDRNVDYDVVSDRRIRRRSRLVEKIQLALCAALALIVIAVLSYLLVLGEGHKKMAHATFVGGVLVLMILVALVMMIFRRPYGEAVITVMLVVCTGFFVIMQLDDLMK